MSLYTEGKFKTREAYRLARGFDLLYRGEKTEDMPLIYADWRGQENIGNCDDLPLLWFLLFLRKLH